MKKKAKLIIFIIAFLMLGVKPVSNYSNSIKGVYKISEITIIEDRPVLGDRSNFLHAIGHRESSNRYSVVNPYGYLGRYQFSPETLKSIGFRVTEEEFLNNPTLQERAMNRLLRINKRLLKKYIKKYDGQYRNGIYITESGILAAAHLVGKNNVVAYFENGKVSKDGFGTKITEYLKDFSRYQLKL